MPKSRSSRALTASLLKEKERRAKQCISSAWLLLRLLASRIPGIENSRAQKQQSPTILACRLSWSELLKPVFDVLHEEARESIYKVRRFTRAPLLASQDIPASGSAQATGGAGSADQGLNASAGTSRMGITESVTDIHTDTSAATVPLGPACTLGAGLTASHRKRCQELIGSPRRFMNMEDGFVFPAEHLLCNPGRGTDFSLSFWLYLTQDSTGKYRTILTRGHKAERWPVIMLRDVDRRIEVGFGLSSMATLCERLTSKDPVPLNKWIHVCLVSEGSKLRLYMNGSLDYQRSNLGVPKECKHPLYVGKVPDGAVRLQGVKGGFEGSLASLRYYTRALSPIHVRIVCDQGPPELVRVKDRKCFQICSLISLVATSPLARPHLCSRPWLSLLLYIIIHGTSRVQQAAVRILIQLLPYTAPTVVSSLTLLDTTFDPAVSLPSSAASGPSLEVPSGAVLVDASSAVRYFLRLIGLGFHRTRLDSVSRIYSSFRENKALPLLGEVTIHSAVSCHETFAHFLPSNIAICCLAKELPSTTSDISGDALSGVAALSRVVERVPPGTSNVVTSSESIQESWALSSELTMLLQSMACLPAWKSAVASTLTGALQGFSALYVGTSKPQLPGPDRITDEQRLKYAEGIAALSVLGGHCDSIRTGVRAGIQHTDMSGFVVGYDEIACLANMVISSQACPGRDPQDKVCRRFSQESKFVGAGSGRNTTHDRVGKSLRVNADEIFVLSDVEKSVALWNQDGMSLALQPAALSMIAICSNLLTNDRCLVTPPVLEGTATALNDQLQGSSSRKTYSPSEAIVGAMSEIVTVTTPSQPAAQSPAAPEKVLPPSSLPNENPTTPTAGIEETLLAQVRSLCVKIVCCMVSNRDVLNDLLVNHAKFLQQLLFLAIQPDSSPNFMTLEESEVRAVIMRKRISQLVAHDVERRAMRGRAYDGNTDPPDSALRHLGTSLLNCPACLVRLPGGLRSHKVSHKDDPTRPDQEAFDAEEQVELGDGVSLATHY